MKVDHGGRNIPLVKSFPQRNKTEIGNYSGYALNSKKFQRPLLFWRECKLQTFTFFDTQKMVNTENIFDCDCVVESRPIRHEKIQSLASSAFVEFLQVLISNIMDFPQKVLQKYFGCSWFCECYS